MFKMISWNENDKNKKMMLSFSETIQLKKEIITIYKQNVHIVKSLNGIQGKFENGDKQGRGRAKCNVASKM